MTAELRQQEAASMEIADAPVRAADPAPVSMAVVGVGHFGAVHARKLARLPGVRLVAVTDLDAARAGQVAQSLGVPSLASHRQLPGAIEAAVVAVPTRAHAEVAADLLRQGIDVLVEKPIAHDIAAGRELIELAESSGRILQVGHLERYSGVVEALRRLEAHPRYVESLRIAPFKARSTDVNVIMDMMIHDLDLLLCLVGSTVVSVDATGIPVFTDSEDIASVRLRFADGCVANLVASRVSLKTQREMRIFESQRYMAVDLVERSIRVIHRADVHDPLDPGAYGLRTESYREADALERELLAFAAAVRSRSAPEVDGRAGLRALEAAQMITESIRGGGYRTSAAATAAARPYAS